jgi:NAD(P)-dependent dehydrogenase (short-subunit alcohol dehydrogenase family)
MLAERLAGSVALVTGGASGLGEATVRHLHERGASVVLFDRDEPRATAIAAELGDRVKSVAGDATSEDDTRAAIDAASRLGALRHVVACAGGGAGSGRTVARDGTPHDLDMFVDTLHLNVVSTFNTVRLAAAAMAALDPLDDDGERGSIVTTSSIAAFEGQIGQVAYGTAKAAIAGMTLIAARDLAAVGVRVNAIAPGTIATRIWDRAPAELRQSLEAKVPFPKRFGRPEEFAMLVAHLLTNSYINGEVIRLDGAIRFDPK